MELNIEGPASSWVDPDIPELLRTALLIQMELEAFRNYEWQANFDRERQKLRQERNDERIRMEPRFGGCGHQRSIERIDMVDERLGQHAKNLETAGRRWNEDGQRILQKVSENLAMFRMTQRRPEMQIAIYRMIMALYDEFYSAHSHVPGGQVASSYDGPVDDENYPRNYRVAHPTVRQELPAEVEEAPEVAGAATVAETPEATETRRAREFYETNEYVRGSRTTRDYSSHDTRCLVRRLRNGHSPRRLRGVLLRPLAGGDW